MTEKSTGSGNYGVLVKYKNNFKNGETITHWYPTRTLRSRAADGCKRSNVVESYEKVDR